MVESTKGSEQALSKVIHIVASVMGTPGRVAEALTTVGPSGSTEIVAPHRLVRSVLLPPIVSRRPHTV